MVAQGFAQHPEIHFNQTFAPVRIGFIRIVAVATRYGLDIQQLDMTTAHLNGIIDEQMYMSSPKMLDKSLEMIIESEANNSKLSIKAKSRN